MCALVCDSGTLLTDCGSGDYLVVKFERAVTLFMLAPEENEGEV